MYARLAHNHVLQAAARDRFAYACERIDVLRARYADSAGTTWVLNGNEANELADAAATAGSALRALLCAAAGTSSTRRGFCAAQEMQMR
jgi:hypothetical protein